MKRDFSRLCKFFSHFKKLWIPYVIATIIIASRNFIITVLNAAISSNAVEMVEKWSFDWTILLIIIVCIICFSLFDSAGIFFQTTIIHKIGMCLREKMFCHALRAKEEKLDSFGSRQELISRMNYDIDGATGFLSYGILSPIMCCISGIGATIIVIRYSCLLCLIIYLIGAFIFVSQLALAKIIRKKSTTIQESKTSLFSFCMQSFQNSLTIKMSNLKESVCNKYTERANRYKRLSIEKGKIDGIYGVIRGVLNLVCFFGVFCYCHLIAKMELADTIFIIQIAPLICTMILSISDLYANMQRSMVNIDRIEELFDLQLEDESGSDFVMMDNEILLSKNVTCKYVDCRVKIKDFSINKNQGKIFAISGASGCGKTTLLRLLLKLFDYEDGQLCLFGQEIKECSSPTLRKHISYVPQENMVFPGTVRENVLYGNSDKSISDSKILELFDKIGAKELVSTIGLNTYLNENGTNLSGGQRQIIAIVRAILYAKPILFLDEAFASIDEKYTSSIMTFLSQCNLHIFIVTHSEKIIKKCDAVITLSTEV